MKRTLLIVEDDEVLASALEEQFKEADFEVEVAVDGEEALNMLKKIKPDMVLLDLILPKINGFDVLQRIKADMNLKSIPVIILSNLGQDQDIKKGMELGAADYFVKAQHPLLEIIEKVSSFFAIPKSPLTKETFVPKISGKTEVVKEIVNESGKIIKPAIKIKKEIKVEAKKPEITAVKKEVPVSAKKKSSEIPKSVKKFIRKQKEEIKKTIINPEERKKKIEELYKQYGKEE